MNLGAAEKQKDDFVHAKEHLREALMQGRHYGDKNLIAWSLMSLADIAAAGGDSITAKRMNEEVLAIFRQIGVKMNVAGGLQRLADLELSMADTRLATQHYSESFEIFREIGQQLASSYPMCGLGDIFFAAGDLQGARKKYAEALSVREKLHGNARYIFVNRIKLARLSLEEGNASDAEASVRQALGGYSAQNEPRAQIEADMVMVQALLAQHKLAAAREVVADDRELIVNTQDRVNVLRMDISDALVEAATGNSAEAVRGLRTTIEETRSSGFTSLQLEARLALGETELKAGNLTAARAVLATLERDAKAKGFMLMARKAAAARKQH